MVWVFWLSTLMLFYVYLGYPALLWLWSLGRQPYFGQPGYTPSVSIMIAAYNEAAYIEQKIRNALAVNYPRSRLQVVLISDGSDDGTMELARRATDDRLVLSEVRPRQGKANALNMAMSRATGEILVFTDANVLFDADAVARLAEHFADPECGCVSGRVDLLPMGADEPLGEGVYMRFERFLQAMESRVSTVVGTDGALFAARRELVEPLPPTIVLDDFLIAMRIAAAGYAVRYEDRARGVERVPASVAQEFRRKVRIAAGGFQVLPLLGFLRKPLHYPVLCVCFVSHKLLRWLSPWFLLGLFVASLALAGTPLYALALAAQLVFYSLALIGWLLPRSRMNTLVYVPYYFSAVSLAFLFGLLRQVSGGQAVTWQPVDRKRQQS